MSLNKVISREELDSVRRWELPSVESRSGGQRTALATAEELERLQQQAYDEGFALGREEGLRAAQDEIDQQVGHLHDLVQALQEPFAQLDREVETELVSLAMDMCRQLVRREIKADPGQVMAVVHEALAVLPVANRTVRLCLHPEDASLVRGALATPEGAKQLAVVEDPVLTRGGCRLVTENSQIDATVETRLAAIFARVMGGERESDRNGS